MEGYLRNDFDLPCKNSSEEAKRRWRKAVWFVVKNRRRRFRHVADLEKRSEAEAKKKSIQKSFREKLRVAVIVQQAALNFIQGAREEALPKVPLEVEQAGFGIDADVLASIVREHSVRRLHMYKGVEGISQLVASSLNEGITLNSDNSNVPIPIDVRQKIYGCNSYIEKPSRNFWMFLWDAMQDLTLIILAVCAFVSVSVGLATEGWPKGMYDGLGIILSIFLVVMVTAASDYRQSLQFRYLDKEKKNIQVQVSRDHRRQKVSIFELVVGDIVHLSIGDLVPADGLYISGYSLLIDESSLSGESEPVNISTDRPFLLAGTKVQNGAAKMLVTSVGLKTEWGRLMETLNQGGEDETPLQVKLNGVATIIGKIGLAFAIMTFLLLLGRLLYRKAFHAPLLVWSSDDALLVLSYFATAVTIIVVAVPEGLPLAVTLSLAFAMKKLMDNKALVRHLSACETMGSATCICTDKTGTLTTNHMVVHKIWICESSVAFNKQAANDLRSKLSPEVYNILLQCVFLNCGSEVVVGRDGKRTILGTPTESALLEFALELDGNFQTQQDGGSIVKVKPFNSNEKKMSTLVSLPSGGVRAFCKGASEIILQMCDKIIDGNSNTISLSEKQKNDILKIIIGFSGEALRTLCIAFKDLDVAENKNDIPTDGYTLVAVFGIKDPVRLEVKQAIEACKAAGITVRMVTGDNIHTAKAVARECGILTDGGIAIEGLEFRNWNPSKMKNMIPKLQVLARSLPSDKQTLVTNLRKLHFEVVAVTGDGINDASALHEADIGFAMGVAGTEVAKEVADVIVMDDNFSTITNVAKWGRSVYINIQKFVQFQLTVNVVALMINFLSACIIGSAPLTAVQLLWVNMIMDTLGALALATEPPDDGMMKKPPVGRNESFITKIMWRNIIGQSIYQLVVLGILMFDGKKLLKLNGPDGEVTLNTFIFNTFVFCQVFNEINSRELEKINVFQGFFRSWIFTVIMISTVAFQVIIVEFLGTFAHTVPLSRHLWLLSVLVGAVSMVVGIFLKCIPVDAEAKQPVSDSDGYQRLPSGVEVV